MVDEQLENMSDNLPDPGPNNAQAGRKNLEPTIQEEAPENALRNDVPESDNPKEAPVIPARKGPSARELYRIPTSPLKGKYEFIQVIGAGGAGVIYKAKQNPLNRIVAIKMVHSHIVSPTSLMRFEKEAKTISTLNHPNIIAIHDFGVSEDEQPYMVMDYIEGIPLSDYIKQNERLSLEETMDFAAQICDGLSHAHRKGILHRDLKPNNLMLLPLENGSYHVKILDFGLAKILHGDEEDERDHLTKTGETVGTPAYMSPEQVMGKGLDQRTDVYSLGCVIYHCLTGEPPFLGETKMETMLMHLNKAPEPVNERLSEQAIEPFYDQLILKLLAKEAGDRYNNLLEVKESIEKAAKGLFDSYQEGQIPANNQLDTLNDSLSDQEKTLVDERKSELSATQGNWINKNKTPLLIVLGSLMLGIPFFTMVGNLNKSVQEEANKPDSPKNKKEMEYRKALDEALEPENYHNELFIADLRKNTKAKEISVGKYQITDSALKHLKEVHNLYILDLKNSLVTGAGLKYVVALPSIHELDLSGTKIEDEDLELLKRLPDLKKLNLTNTKTTDTGAAVLSSINSLISLNLEGTQIGDPALPEIEKLSHLQELSLANTKVDDDKLESLQKLPVLTDLNLSGCAVTDIGLKKLGSLKTLGGLNLSKTELTSQGIQHLVGMKELRELDLSGTKLDNSSIKYLLQLTALRRLKLVDCKISMEKALPLRRKINNLVIYMDPS